MVNAGDGGGAGADRAAGAALAVVGRRRKRTLPGAMEPEMRPAVMEEPVIVEERVAELESAGNRSGMRRVIEAIEAMPAFEAARLDGGVIAATLRGEVVLLDDAGLVEKTRLVRLPTMAETGMHARVALYLRRSDHWQKRHEGSANSSGDQLGSDFLPRGSGHARPSSSWCRRPAVG